MSCEKCAKMRADYVQAIINRKLGLVATLTVEAVKHMIGGDDGADVSSVREPVVPAIGSPDAGGVQKGRRTTRR